MIVEPMFYPQKNTYNYHREKERDNEGDRVKKERGGGVGKCENEEFFVSLKKNSEKTTVVMADPYNYRYCTLVQYVLFQGLLIMLCSCPHIKTCNPRKTHT